MKNPLVEDSYFEYWDKDGHRLHVVTNDGGDVWFEVLESETAYLIHCASIPKALIDTLTQFLTEHR